MEAALTPPAVLAAIGAPPDTVPSDTIDRQAFRVGSLQLVIRFADASELAAMPPLSRLPGAPEGVHGLCNLHGNIVPVMDIAGWLGQHHDAEKTPMLLVCGYGEEAVGIIIDGLPDRKKFQPSAIIPLDQLERAVALFARAAYQDETGVWIELDYPRLFGEYTRGTH